MSDIVNNTDIDSLIDNEQFHSIIEHFNNKLNNNDDNDNNSGSESSSTNYTSDNEDTILDNYLLNSDGENITDVLTKINKNLILLISKLT